MKLSHADAPPPFQRGKPVGNIYFGACGWTDRTLIEAGTFYPRTARKPTLRPPGFLFNIKAFSLFTHDPAVKRRERDCTPTAEAALREPKNGRGDPVFSTAPAAATVDLRSSAVRLKRRSRSP